MKIQGPNQPGSVDRARQDPRPSGTDVTGSSSTASAEDAVQFSSSAQALAAARAPETPDTARVDALRDAITSGSFEVDPRRIAEAMLREER